METLVHQLVAQIKCPTQGKHTWTYRTTPCGTAQPPGANKRRADAHQGTGGAAGKKDPERPLSTMRGSSPEATLQAEYPQPDNRGGLLACASTYYEYLCAFALLSGAISLDSGGTAGNC